MAKANPLKKMKVEQLYKDTVSLKQLEGDFNSLYLPTENTIWFYSINPGNTWSYDRWQTKRKELHSSYPDLIEPAPPEVIEELRVRAERSESNKKKNKEKRKFEKAALGTEDFDTTTTTLRFLQGATSGGSPVGIKGDALGYYMGLLLYRIGHNEYLMGTDLSGAGKNNPSVAARVLATVTRHNNCTLWPSTVNWIKSGETPDANAEVFKWCLRRFRGVCLKLVAAKQKAEAYRMLYEETLKVYNKAKKRWNTEDTEIESLIEAYNLGIEEMKKRNDALKMRFKLMGEL